MTRSISDIRGLWADPKHCLRESDEEDVHTLLDALDAAERRAEAAERALGERDVCEVCGDCLMPEPPRCERHAHTERGDDEWPDDES